jgi:2'-5' RNA ligase
VRLFVALDVPPEVRARVGALTVGLGRAAPRADVRWSSTDTLHVTLKFLGEVPDAGVANVARAVGGVAARHAPLALEAAGAGCFPSATRPRVVYVGIRGRVDALARLAGDVDGALEALGFPGERRAFHAHLTVGRVRSARGSAGLAAALRAAATESAGGWTADEVLLYRSRLHPKGAVHEVVARFPLSGSGRADP